MNDVTAVLSAIEAGDPDAAEQLLPLVYEELRKLAAQRLSHEKAGQTLQATALVHEAYLRLLPASPRDVGENRDAGEHPNAGEPGGVRWNSRGHFFAAAAEAMRRILVERARRKLRLRHGGGLVRRDLDACDPVAPRSPEEMVALSEALDRLAEANPQAAELVKLRYFAGLTNERAAEALGVSPRRANQIWAYARAWLLECLGHEPS
jgi:RNA polymerase sigma factor (sigma-70 family)